MVASPLSDPLAAKRTDLPDNRADNTFMFAEWL